MRGRLLKVLMVILVLVPVGLTAYLANSLYHRKGVPEALENLTKQLFQSKADERKAERRAVELEHKTEELQTAYDSLVADLRGEVDSREIRVRQFREKLEINFVDKVLFASGSAEITPHGRDVLLKVAGVFGKVRGKSIYVVGHTDTMPIHSGLYPSNWELSTARAASVVRFLSETGGLAPQRFTAMGRAFYQPVASNATPEGRQENRRVDVIVADVPIFAGEPGPEAAGGDTSGAKSGEAADEKSDQPAAPLRETSPQPAVPAPQTPSPADESAASASVPPESESVESPVAAPQAPAKPAAPATEPAAGTASQPGANPAKAASASPEAPAAPTLPPPLPDRPATGR